MVAGVELPREENRGTAQDLIVLAEPLVLRLQPLDLGRLLGRDAGSAPVVDLGPGQPAPHGLPRDTSLAGHRSGGRGQGGVRLLALAHEPHAPRARSWGSIFFGMLSILSDSNSSGIKPGPIQF